MTKIHHPIHFTLIETLVIQIEIAIMDLVLVIHIEHQNDVELLLELASFDLNIPLSWIVMGHFHFHRF